MFKDRKLIERLDKMLDEGINGTFEESNYDETQLSKLETKWLRYLTSSKLSFQKTEQEREKLKELVSDISHQTRTPLANILLYTQLLQEQELDDTGRELVDEISRQSEKLQFLIEALIKTSRLETGTYSFVTKLNSIDELIRMVIEQVSPKADKKNISISYDTTGESAVFDIKWTQEALFNIADNAVKYTDNGGKIDIYVKCFEMFCCITVEDNGIGIPEEDIERVFGRFFRSSNVHEKEGVGIGLYLCRNIIEGQGGYVTVSSKPGEGSCFMVYLPRS